MRKFLLHNELEGGYLAVEKLPDDMTNWVDVTGDKFSELMGVMCGEWVGGSPLPRDLCKNNTEHGHQAALFCWIAAINNVGISKDVIKMYAIPNGGKRDAATAAMLKAEGVRRGIPDLFLPVPIVVTYRNRTMLHGLFNDSRLTNDVLSGLYIEMKKPKEGKTSEEQKQRIAELKNDGYACVVSRNWVAAKDIIICYLNLKENIASLI